MKKIFSLLLGLFLAGTSCVNTDLDTLQPINSIPTDGAINNFPSATAAVNGVYSTIQDNNYDGYLLLAQAYTDEVDFVGTFPTRIEFEVLTINTSNGTLAGVFTNFYDAINVINNVIEAIPPIEDPSLDDATKNSIIGEMKFLRAFNYFYLVNYHGAIPLVLEPTREVGEVLFVPNSSVDEVYAQIITDLQDAERDIQDDGNVNRASSLAATALLSRVYLYRQDWTNALAKAEEALGAGFDLTEYPYMEDQVFSLGFTTADGHSLPFFYGPAEFGGREDAAPSQKIRDAYETGDLRRPLSIDDSYTVSPDFAFTVKYNDYGATGTSTDPLLFIRHAELVLIAAEAAAELGEWDTANMYYNMVRARAGLPAKTLNAGNYVDLILQERFVELAFEGPHRYFDLRRRGRAADEIEGYQPCNDIWPIPQRDIDRNPNLVQNTCCTC